MSVGAKCRGFVLANSAGYDGSHDISHIDRVTTNAVKIFSLSDLELDIDVLIAIASLHDSFDHKYLTTSDLVEEAKRKVETFLSQDCAFSEATISMIIDVIDKMGFTAEVTANGSVALESPMKDYLHIVQDADRLDAMGAIGIARCLTFSGAFGRPIITAEGTEELGQKEKYMCGDLHASSRKGPSAISHFYDKLLFLKDMLKTPEGRKLGEKRHAFLLSFLEEFFDELS